MPTLEHTLDERGSRYGRFSNNAKVSQAIKDAMMDGFAASPTIPDCKLDANMAVILEALDMIALKISRIVTGDPTYVDNWHDIAGYAAIVEKHLNEKQNAKSS